MVAKRERCRGQKDWEFGRILIFVPEVVCVLFNHLIVLYFLLSMTLHSTLFGKLIQKRGKKNMCEAPNLKFIIDMLAIINKMQLPIFSLFNVFLSAISGPLFFFLSYATLVPVVLLIVIACQPDGQHLSAA